MKRTQENRRAENRKCQKKRRQTSKIIKYNYYSDTESDDNFVNVPTNSDSFEEDLETVFDINTTSNESISDDTLPDTDSESSHSESEDYKNTATFHIDDTAYEILCMAL